MRSGQDRRRAARSGGEPRSRRRRLSVVREALGAAVLIAVSIGLAGLLSMLAFAAG